MKPRLKQGREDPRMLEKASQFENHRSKLWKNLGAVYEYRLPGPMPTTLNLYCSKIPSGLCACCNLRDLLGALVPKQTEELTQGT